MKELRQSHNIETERRCALSVAEQDLFIDFLKNEKTPYHHWLPVFEVMVDTGMRVGKVTGLRWCDVDSEENLITADHKGLSRVAKSFILLLK